MREFDPNKPHSILGCGNIQYILQDGRRYLPRKNKPPQVLISIGGKKTEGGGKVFKCMGCGMEFGFQNYLGMHYKSSEPCGRVVKRRKADRQLRYTNKVRTPKILEQILGD